MMAKARRAVAVLRRSRVKDWEAWADEGRARSVGRDSRVAEADRPYVVTQDQLLGLTDASPILDLCPVATTETYGEETEGDGPDELENCDTWFEHFADDHQVPLVTKRDADDQPFEQSSCCTRSRTARGTEQWLSICCRLVLRS